MSRPGVKIVCGILVASIWAGFQTEPLLAQAKKVLFHGGGVFDPGSNFQGADGFVLNHLSKDLNLDVTFKTAGTVELGEYDTFDGLVFSPTNDSGDGRGKGIKTTTAPVLNWEDSLYKDTDGDFYFQQAALRGVAGLAQVDYPQPISAIEIVDAAHPLAAGLSAGVHTIYREPQSASWAAVDGFPPGALGIAKLVPAPGDPEPTAGAWGLFAAEPGTEMLDGSTTPARRVGFPAFEDSVAQFTPEGYQLLATSVSWMLGIDPPADGDTNGDRVVDLTDFNAIASNFLTGEFDPGTRASVYTPEKLRWRDEGDLNWDRVVDFADFGIWKQAALAAAGPANGVPEPGSLALLGWGALLFCFRRRALSLKYWLNAPVLSRGSLRSAAT